MSDDHKISELMLLWEESRKGAQPASAEELCSDCQNLLPEVQRRVAALQAVYQVLDAGTQDQPLDEQLLNEWTMQSDEQPGTRIGRYRIEKVLGQGGFGRVYQARDDQLDRSVAIKVPRRRALPGSPEAEAYLAEARVVAGLSHANIVPVHDVGTTPDGLCFVVSKLVEGSDLAHLLFQARFTHRLAAELVAAVADALHHAHRRGLVHRDIKPANILIDSAGTPYVADFGVALKEQDLGKGTGFVGTPAYMSPEQARGEGHRVDGRSDIFSLGVVFYELLTGRLPFVADFPTDLLDLIVVQEARPPRMVDDKIPRELERICLKALAKKVGERFTTAFDFADDLRYYLAHTSTLERAPAPPQPASALVTLATMAVGETPPEQRPIKIVPKGLRSFDGADADFFLELLPGPRDREGLPDSIRFWKTRIEETDADNTFSVGLIYGPSGCGKSSLVKAGLLPRLSDDVIAVYVEATAEETEARLLKGLRKHCPDVPEKLGVIDTLAALRRGHYLPAGKKVVIVLDQFEQWLQAKGGDANTELVRALRHCDGERLQCIEMVRDDFGMAATRFMGAVDIPIVQGHNFAAVDLFDRLHSRKVLAEFGRAFGRLPDNLGKCTKEQEGFLDQAVSSLAQEGKVISVQLALFAEMVKGKPWTPATLKEVGGMKGVGVTFLEETFAASTAPPQHRLHQKAAQAVLKALLPDIGTNIKGNMRSRQELLVASGYAAQPKGFDGLLRILDGELRFITPTDPEGVDSENASSTKVTAGEKYYQLTHDYLVHSLRDWLTRKQKETRRGRAELLLSDRAAVWNARPENRQLPSLWQWCSIRWLTAKKDWTPPQRKMMRKATRYHAVRGMALALMLAVATITGLAIWEQVEERRNATRAAGLVQAVLKADTAQVPAIIGEMAAYRNWADPLLVEEYDKAAAKSSQKLHASLALLPVDAMQVDYLYSRLLDAAPSEVPVIRDALARHKDTLLDKLWKVAEASDNGKERQRLRAAAALAKYDPENQKWMKANALMVNDLVLENPIFLGQWSEAFRPVKGHLVAPLSVIFRDHQPERAAERKLATNLLADYASNQPQALADLLMDADDMQFAVLYPKVTEHGDRSVSRLLAEIEKPPLVVKDKMIFERKGTIAEDDGKVKVSQGAPMSAKRYEVSLQGGKKYRLTMDSQEFDSFLVLQDKTGKELAFDDDSGGNLDALLVYTPSSDDTYTVFAASIDGFGSFVLKIMETMGGDGGKVKLAKRQANAAVALLKMNQPEKVWPLLRHTPDPRVRSYLIHRLGPLGADANAIVERLGAEKDLTIQRALLLSLGEYGEKEFSPEQRTALLPKLQETYRTDADPGLHAATEWLLRIWRQETWLNQVNEEWKKDQAQREKRLDGIKDLLTRDKEKTPPQWYVNGQGQTMVVIPGPVEFMMGSPTTEAGRFDYEPQHKKRIGRTFALAAKSVTVEQYRQFDKSYQLPAVYTRLPHLPVVGTSWYQAAEYCNWLSKQEGIDPDQWCYEMKKGEVTELKANYLSLTGYRLPTEAEMEYATRAGALTSRYYGETEELLPKYAWYLKNSQDNYQENKTWPVGSLKPNDLGLFDVQGNVFTWCQERDKAYPSILEGKVSDDEEDEKLVIDRTLGRVMRGGSFLSLASNVRSANRYNYVPSTQFNDYGFRAARTLRLVSFTALPSTPEGGRK